MAKKEVWHLYCLQHSYTPSPKLSPFPPGQIAIETYHFSITIVIDFFHLFSLSFHQITYFAIISTIYHHHPHRNQSIKNFKHSHMPTPYPGMRSILAKSHSLLHNGQTLRVFNQRWMQSRWNTCPHVPNVMLSPLSFVGLGLA